MGKKSAEIEYELERQRNALRARTERLDRRVRDDVATVKDEAGQDLNRTIGRDSKAAQHPKALVGGAAGTGILLGKLSSKISLRSLWPSRNGHTDEPPPPSRTQRMMGAASGTAVGTFQNEIDNLVADIWRSFKSGFSGDEPRTPREYQLPRRTGASAGGIGATAKLDGDPEEAPSMLHDAAVEDFAPQEDLGVSPGLQGEGVLLPSSDKTSPVPDEGTARRTGQ